MSEADELARIAADHGVDEGALRAAVNAEFARRGRERQERREARAAKPQPATGRYAKLRSGDFARKNRPQGAGKSSVSDRALIPPALRHWRQIHGLTTRQAQARIGYSPSSASWRHWEDGFVAPPYKTLLLIIASTGFGFINDVGSMPPAPDPEGRLQAEARQRQRGPIQP